MTSAGKSLASRSEAGEHPPLADSGTLSVGRPRRAAQVRRMAPAATRRSRSQREDLEEHMDQMHAAMCKTTSNPVRLRILTLLGRRELSVGALAAQLGHPIPTVSKHLQLMKDQGVVSARRDGNVIHYRVADQRILRAIALIREVLMSRMKRESSYLEAA